MTSINLGPKLFSFSSFNQHNVKAHELDLDSVDAALTAIQEIMK